MSDPAAATDGGMGRDAAEYGAMHARLCALGAADAAFIDRCFQLFVQETAADLARLDAIITQGDAAAVVSTAHRLKGACLTIGAAQMAACCTELETGARDGARLEAMGVLPRLAVLFQDLCWEVAGPTTGTVVPDAEAGQPPSGSLR